MRGGDMLSRQRAGRGLQLQMVWRCCHDAARRQAFALHGQIARHAERARAMALCLLRKGARRRPGSGEAAPRACALLRA